MTRLVRGLMYGKPARVDAYFAKTTRRNTDNFWHGEFGRRNDTIDNNLNGKYEAACAKQYFRFE